jgi:hypothetical protein
LKPAPALASEPIVRSWGVRSCTQFFLRCLGDRNHPLCYAQHASDHARHPLPQVGSTSSTTNV